MASLDLIGTYGGATELQTIKDDFQKKYIKLNVGGDYPADYYFEIHKNNKKDNTLLLNGINPGDEIKVFFNLRCNAVNDKFFTNLVAWKIEKTEASNQGQYKAPAPAQNQNTFQ